MEIIPEEIVENIKIEDFSFEICEKGQILWSFSCVAPSKLILEIIF